MWILRKWWDLHCVVRALKKQMYCIACSLWAGIDGEQYFWLEFNHKRCFQLCFLVVFIFMNFSSLFSLFFSFSFFFLGDDIYATPPLFYMHAGSLIRFRVKPKPRMFPLFMYYVPFWMILLFPSLPETLCDSPSLRLFLSWFIFITWHYVIAMSLPCFYAKSLLFTCNKYIQKGNE